MIEAARCTTANICRLITRGITKTLQARITHRASKRQCRIKDGMIVRSAHRDQATVPGMVLDRALDRSTIHGFRWRVQ